MTGLSTTVPTKVTSPSFGARTSPSLARISIPRCADDQGILGGINICTMSASVAFRIGGFHSAIFCAAGLSVRACVTESGTSAIAMNNVGMPRRNRSLVIKQLDAEGVAGENWCGIYLEWVTVATLVTTSEQAWKTPGTAVSVDRKSTRLNSSHVSI